MEWINILWGIIGGAAVGLTGFVRKKQDFDINKIAPTVITSVIIGGIAGFVNADFEAIEAMAFTGSLSIIVTNVWKGFYRRWKDK